MLPQWNSGALKQLYMLIVRIKKKNPITVCNGMSENLSLLEWLSRVADDILATVEVFYSRFLGTHYPWQSLQHRSRVYPMSWNQHFRQWSKHSAHHQSSITVSIDKYKILQ